MNRIYLVIDLKTFYASVECVERGLDPFETDLIVANPNRANGAICLAISPKMKQRGIKNICRVYEIPKNIKPIVAMPRMKKYIEYSAKIYSIYLKYLSKNDIHVYSIDEAFLDITNYLKLYNKTPEEIAKMIMKDILNTTGITATCGIGTNMYLAKIALDITAKHVESHIGYLDEEKYKKELWHHLPLTDFWQIGYGIEKRLNKLKIYDMYDIACADPKILYKEFGVNAVFLIDHSIGKETCTISDIKKYKPNFNSLSNSQILYKDYDYKEARIVLMEMVDTMILELVNKSLVTGAIGFSIGYSKDTIKSTGMSKRLDVKTNNYREICNILLEYYDMVVNHNFYIRRISIWFSNVSKKEYRQLDLFHNINDLEQEENLENTINSIKNKFGKNAILRAISYEECATARDRNKLIGGHNAE